jgi:hypothetical protein
VLTLFLSSNPQAWRDFLILTSWGLLAGAMMWWKRGPWVTSDVSFFWIVAPLALCHWLGDCCLRPRAARPAAADPSLWCRLNFLSSRREAPLFQDISSG